jgi:DNA-binding NarL/FixJ family response regulator
MRSQLEIPNMDARGTIRILVVDDYVSIRAFLRAILKKVPGVEVVGEAEDGSIAVELAHKLMPDIIIMDISMPVLDGIEATKWITSVFSDVKVIAFTAFADKSTMKRMFEAGASGFLLKGCGVAEIASAIKTVAEDKEVCVTVKK